MSSLTGHSRAGGEKTRLQPPHCASVTKCRLSVCLIDGLFYLWSYA